MKFGWCGTTDQAADMRAAGLDYIEVQLVPMKLEDDACFRQAKDAVRTLPLPGLVLSYLFPHDMRVVGPSADDDRNRRYFDRVVEILMLTGARVVVYGSGWTRNVPEGGDRAAAEQQFLHTLSWCADALQGTGAMLVIEPLNRKETNFVNRVADGVRFARMINRPQVRGLADFYHMDEENEALSEIETHAAWLGHIHLADTGRLNPGTGTYDYATFFSHLRKGGYNGFMSAECRLKGEPVAAMRESARFLRQKWQRV